MSARDTRKHEARRRGRFCGVVCIEDAAAARMGRGAVQRKCAWNAVLQMVLRGPGVSADTYDARSKVETAVVPVLVLTVSYVYSRPTRPNFARLDGDGTRASGPAS